jgi:hypothetical protein
MYLQDPSCELIITARRRSAAKLFVKDKYESRTPGAVPVVTVGVIIVTTICVLFYIVKIYPWKSERGQYSSSI